MAVPATEHIYGIDYETPSKPANPGIAGHDLVRQKQKFYRTTIPAIFEELEFDEDGEPLYTEEHITFIDQELDRIEHGYWFFNCGKAVYITGLHYFYLNYWTLENGEPPEYREADRRYFYFQDHCERQPFIDGIIRSKKRREGATSQATADLVKTAITKRRAFCGIISKTGKDAKDCFIKMVQPGFRSMPIFLKPRVQDPESKTELFFIAKKSEMRKKKGTQRKGKLYDDSMGLGSLIDYRPTELNSYDSGRLTKVLKDEGGKDPADCPVNEYWPIVKQTLRQGAMRVGFALLPSTSNKLTKGGRGFKKLWDESNQFTSTDGRTASGLYRYFCPADDGYVPFIDEHGYSIRQQPTKEQARWMKEHYHATDEQCTMTAKEYLLLERARMMDEDARREHMRLYPLVEKEAFDYEDSQTIYNLENILNQKQYLQDNPVKLRRATFFKGIDGKVDWRDDPNGAWLILKLPTDAEVNAVMEMGGQIRPANKHRYVLTADPFKNTIVSGKGSKGCGIIWLKLDPLDPENSGMPIALFYGRPKLTRMFHMQMLYAAEYYGAEVCYESDFDSYYEIFMQEGRLGYVKERPANTIDPNRRKNPKHKEFGIKSADGFSYNMMLDRSQAYVELYCTKIYFMDILLQLEEYDVNERTLYDIAVAFQLGTVAISDPVRAKIDYKPQHPMIKTYRIKVPTY